MKVTLLGTGCPLPVPDRAGAATLVQAAGRNILVDAGRGVLMRLAGAGVMPQNVDAVLITHLHSDHIQDLSDVITMQWAMTLHKAPLQIVGPPGIRAFIGRLLDAMRDDIDFRIAHHADLTWEPILEVTEVHHGTSFRAEDLHVTTGLVDHGVVQPALGFRFEHEGTAACISGDTMPCDGLDDLARDADIYVQAVLRSKLVEAIPAPRLQDVLDYHSSTFDAGETAKRCGVDTLVLTHMVPSPPAGTEQEWVDEAASHFEGDIVFGNDLTAVSR